MAHAAVRGGGGQTDHVEQCPASDAHHVTVPVDVVYLNFRLNLRDVKVRVFRTFASLELHRFTDEMQPVFSLGAVRLDLFDQIRLCTAQGFVHHDQHLVRAVGLSVDERVAKHVITRLEQPLGKKDLMPVTDFDLSLDNVHWLAENWAFLWGIASFFDRIRLIRAKGFSRAWPSAKTAGQ